MIKQSVLRQFKDTVFMLAGSLRSARWGKAGKWSENLLPVKIQSFHFSSSEKQRVGRWVLFAPPLILSVK